MFANQNLHCLLVNSIHSSLKNTACSPHNPTQLLTADIVRHILTVGAGLPSTHIHIRPSPVRATV